MGHTDPATPSDDLSPKGHPPAIWFFFWGEFAERSSYYGMRAILYLYMTKGLMMPVGKAGAAYSAFKAAAYMLPLAGGYIADRFLGRYWTIVGFSVPYVLGHFILGIPTEWAMFFALALLAGGSGVIKPNISTLLGETYDEKRPGKDRLRSAAFLWFYFAINVGALVSQIALPEIRKHYILTHVESELKQTLVTTLAKGEDIIPLVPKDVLNEAFGVAFAFPAWLMVGSLAVFALGKPFYANKKPVYVEMSENERALQRQTLMRLFGIFALVVLFWFGYEHNDTLWVQFIGDHVNLKLPFDIPFVGSAVSPDQLQFLNALFVILLVPTFNITFGWLDPEMKLFTQMRKVLAGFLLTAASIIVMATAAAIVQGDPAGATKVSIYWPVTAYIVLTFGEVLLYGTMLDLAYAAAPKSMKGFVTACFLLTNTLGNFLNMAWTPLYGTRLAPAQFFGATALIVIFAATAFVFVGRKFQRSQAEAAAANLT